MKNAKSETPNQKRIVDAVMYQPYQSQSRPHISSTFLPSEHSHSPTVPPPAHLYGPPSFSPGPWSCPIHCQPGPDHSLSGSSTSTVFVSDSRPKSLECEHVVTRWTDHHSSPVEKPHIEPHRHHFRDSFPPSTLWDPEKASMQNGHPHAQDPKPSRSSYLSASDDMLEPPSRADEHAVWILIYLAFLSPIITVPVAIYTLLATPFLLLLSALWRLTPHVSSPRTYLLHIFLAPPVNWQFDLILSPTRLADADMSNPSILVLLNLLSPVYAGAIALSAWVAAVFWFYAAILGDPDGRDGMDDGRAAVLGVRGWWERWLQRGQKGL